MITFRKLKKEEIIIEIDKINKTLSLIKKDGVDEDIIDEIIGNDNWSIKYYGVNNVTYVEIGINKNYKSNIQSEYIYKSGTSIKELGELFGIGKELKSYKNIPINNIEDKYTFELIEDKIIIKNISGCEIKKNNPEILIKNNEYIRKPEKIATSSLVNNTITKKETKETKETKEINWSSFFNNEIDETPDPKNRVRANREV